ncbi:MAG: TrkH family potassium uptake protein, partial [Muribaculaceae bacterium]|nr:TrkH family potassium uptake protein [Muribaculaceae bacterium]
SVADMNNNYVKTVMIVFMFLGGVNFALIFKALTGNFKSILRNDALKWYIAIIFICYILLTINVWINGLVREVEDVTVDPLFQAVSILTSTGLTEPDFHDWGSLAVVVLIVMMVMGACAGSTSGGAKIDRFIVLFRFLKNEFYKMMHPNAVTTVVINEKGTPNTVLMKTLAFLFLYIIVIMVGGTVLVILGLPLKDSFFISLSAISNTGLGTDITGIGGNYALVPVAGKWLLSFIMLVGRLELFTILLIFLPSFWRK